LTITLIHSDGTKEKFQANHSYNESQIEWFKAGSALNIIRKSNKKMSEKIKLIDGKLIVPENPVIPFIEGDGTGRDIWKASVRVFDAAVSKSYNGKEESYMERGSCRRKSV
jgi:hypothetical protein